ncbi:MAG: TauD/TfdA family dioxygenase [Rhodospirillaceae bacterium]|nr:TauD/TfdA family dioxygenase [Rhodospirillaceae bacterium]MCY4237281.1 TauD/TfdA family dioxygenase [Rhodospirillaceae bacterium]MCY4309813.1 TauD/TfdA family dioxygenase [Rhodospirillaceae bacterium]
MAKHSSRHQFGVEAWIQEESKLFLDYPYQNMSRSEHTCRFQWDDGSVAFWDNRVTWHHAFSDYHGHRRLMHRITLDGEALAA